MIRKYTDWQSWGAGLLDSAIPAGATALITLLTTNGAAVTFGGAIADIGITWKQALVQVAIHMMVATAKYLQAKPRPQTVVETFETEHFATDEAGKLTTGGSKQTTTTETKP